jgi:hypothetical protein
MTDPAGAAIYGVPWIPSIYPSHVSIYTSTMDPMDPMGYCFNHHLSHRIFRAPVARRGAPVAAPVAGGPDRPEATKNGRIFDVYSILMYIIYIKYQKMVLLLV